MNTQPKFQKMEIGQDDVIDLIFKRNPKELFIGLEVDGLKCTHDLFMFCTEILYKGIVLLFGDPSQPRVAIEEISNDQFNIIKKKMALAGIDVTLRTQAAQENSSVTMIPPQKTQIRVDKPKYGDRLEDYTLVIDSPKTIYLISYKLIHNIK